MEQVQVENEAGLRVGADVEFEVIPEALPRCLMCGQQPVETDLGACQFSKCAEASRCDRGVTRRDDRGDLVDHHGPPVGEVEVEFVGCPTLSGDEPACRKAECAKNGGAGGRGDANLALAGFDLDDQGPFVDAFGGEEDEMAVGECGVLGNIGVRDSGVDPGSHLDASVPAVRGECRFECPKVPAGHRHEPPLGHSHATAGGVDEDQVAGQQSAAEVELTPRVGGVEAVSRPPVAALGADIEFQPVGCIDQLFILDGPALERRCEPVVDPGEVGAGIVDTVVRVFGISAARSQIAVADGREGLAVTLVRRVESLEHQYPRVDPPGAEIELRHIAHHEVGTRRFQISTVAGSIDADDEAEPTGPPCRHARRGVFNNRRLCRTHTESPGSLDEHRRVGLPGQAESGRIGPINHLVEQVIDSGRRE